MPGPPKWRGTALFDAVRNGQVKQSIIDENARRVIDMAKFLGKFDHPDEPPVRAVDDAERDEFIATAGAEGMVLLKNTNGILPINKKSQVAIIGHHATHVSLGGGGSARVDALHAVSPIEGMQKAGFDVQASPGIPVFGALPHAEPSMVTDPEGKTSTTPVKVEWFNSAMIGENLVHTEQRPSAEYMIKEQWPSYLSKDYCSRMTFTLTPSRSGNHIFSVVSTGRTRCLIKFLVKNTGPVFGKVMVQLYVAGSSDVGRKRPVKELKDFVKVGLKPDESRECCLLLDKYAVSVYDGQEGCWMAQQGAYKVTVGLSSVDIRAEVGFELAKTVQWRGV